MSGHTPFCPHACDCCRGVSVETPVTIENRPGLPAIAARVGTFSQFRNSMLARLSSSEYPALQRLQTRDADDVSIALIDSFAMVADVLTFYQERLANESYLRTALELRSIRELAAEIGYEPARGVAASTPLAFTIDDVAGSPRQTAIPHGTKVQSVPGPGETPQTFETVAILDDARVEWNALRPKLTTSQQLAAGARQAYVGGVFTDLKPGDGLVFMTRVRRFNPKKGKFHFCRLLSAEPHRDAGYTVLRWDRPLPEDVIRNQPPHYPAIFLLRQRAAIFGHNAPDWIPLPVTMKANYLGIKDADDLTDHEKLRWPSYVIYAPQYPPAVKAAVVIPTPKSVASAAIRAAQLEAERARNEAIVAAKNALLEAVRIFVEAKDAMQDEVVEQLDGLLETMRMLKEQLDKLPDGIAEIEAFFSSFDELKESVIGWLEPEDEDDDG